MKITLVQEYEIEVPKEYENLSKEELVNTLNSMYDIRGQYIIEESLSAENEYVGTVLTHIDGEEVYLENNKVSSSGYYIILDGQPLE